MDECASELEKEFRREREEEEEEEWAHECVWGEGGMGASVSFYLSSSVRHLLSSLTRMELTSIAVEP